MIFLYAVDGRTFYKFRIVLHHFIVLMQLCQLLTFSPKISLIIFT